jgi:hypothetical protein
LLGGDGLGGDDEVGFVFPRGVVEDDDEFAILWRRGGGLLAFLREREKGKGEGGGRRGKVLKAWMVSGMVSNSEWSIRSAGAEEDGMAVVA